MLNLKRGLQKTILFGLVGFLTPTVLLNIPRPDPSATLSRSERQDQVKLNEFLISQKPAMILRSGSLCAIVFALAAFAAYAPHTGIRFIRSLMIISSITVLSFLLTGTFFPNYKGLHNNLLIDPGIPIVAAVVATAILVIVSVRKTSTASLPESP